MTQVRRKFDENTLPAMLHDAAQHKARKRAAREKQGVERKPRVSAWAQGVEYGFELVEERPGDVRRELARCRWEAQCHPLQSARSYYAGVVFALEGSPIKARFFAQASQRLQERKALVAS